MQPTSSRKLTLRNIGAGYSPRYRILKKQAAIAGGTGRGQSLRQWIKERLQEHPGSSLLSLALALGGLLMLIHFHHIEYLPALDLKSATSLLLGVALTGLLTLGSIALLVAIPGGLLHLCVRYRVLNPGTQDLKDKRPIGTSRGKLKGESRGAFVLYLYTSVAIALALHLGLPSLGITETLGGYSINKAFVAIGVLYLTIVAALTVSGHTKKSAKWLPRIRYRRIYGRNHGFWLLGFLTLFQLVIIALLFSIFPLFENNESIFGIINFGMIISISGAFGIAVRHDWKTAVFSIGAVVLLLLLMFGGLIPIAEGVVSTLKLGNLQNTTLLVSKSGCQTITGMLGCGECQAAENFRVRGINVLSRIGDEQLLSFRQIKQENRFLLPSKEVISLSLPALSDRNTRSLRSADQCVIIEPIMPLTSPPSQAKS